MKYKGNYMLMPGATGDVYTSALIKKSGVKKTCFSLDKPDTLDQEDLEHLYENKHTDKVIKKEVSAPVKKEEKPKVEAKK